MEIIARELPGDCEIIVSGDWHVGATNCNEQAIAEMLEKVAESENTYLMLLGDLIDAIEVSDKRFSMASFSHDITTPYEQAGRVMEMLRPVRDKILFIQLGNHEWKVLNTFSPLDMWCDGLNVPWGGVNCKFSHTRNGVSQWKGFFMHGRRTFTSQAKDPIQAKANREAALKNILKGLSGDAVIQCQAHAHTMLCVEPTLSDQLYLYDDGLNIRQKYRADINQQATYIDEQARWYCCVGSFLNTMSKPGQRTISYAECAGYQPQEHGYIKLTVRDFRMERAERVVV